MNKKQTSSSAQVLEPLYTPEWLYDTLMIEIEPDLTIENSKKLDGKYAGESEQDRIVRMEQYAAAFIIFDECLDELDLEMRVMMEEVKIAMENEILDEDTRAMNAIEESIDSTDFRA